MKESLYSHTSLEWKDILETLGTSGSLSYWLEGLRGHHRSWEKNLSPELLKTLLEKYSSELPTVTKVLEAGDKTVKLQIRFSDGLEAETVLIPFHKRYSICLSTQVGCAMNCSFCYTGTQGLKRHLKTHEIVGQFIVGHNWLKERKVSQVTPNVVFMGQGEPLHNIDEVRQAIKVLNDPLILGVGLRQMTLSTVGHLPGLKKIKDFPKINFALSLHSPFSHERVKLIPAEEKFPLTEVLKELDTIPLMRRQYLTFEYILIKNFNMTSEHATALADLVRDRKAIVNLIPFNPFPGADWERPSEEEILIFKELLVSLKVRVMIRTTKGDDILAACGQLKIHKLAKDYERTSPRL